MVVNIRHCEHCEIILFSLLSRRGRVCFWHCPLLCRCRVSMVVKLDWIDVRVHV